MYTTDLAESLTSAEHQLTVLTNLPNYPWWKTPSEFSHLGEGNSSHHGISVIRVNHLVPPKMNSLLRMLFETSL